MYTYILKTENVIVSIGYHSRAWLHRNRIYYYSDWRYYSQESFKVRWNLQFDAM